MEPIINIKSQITIFEYHRSCLEDTIVQLLADDLGNKLFFDLPVLVFKLYKSAKYIGEFKNFPQLGEDI